MNIFLSSYFFVFKIFFIEFLTIKSLELKFNESIKFINKISFSKKPITLKTYDGFCRNQYCIGTIKIEIDNKWFVMNLNETNDPRMFIQYICNDFRGDNLYSFAFQCVSSSKLLSSVS